MQFDDNHNTNIIPSIRYIPLRTVVNNIYSLVFHVICHYRGSSSLITSEKDLLYRKVYSSEYSGALHPDGVQRKLLIALHRCHFTISDVFGFSRKWLISRVNSMRKHEKYRYWSITTINCCCFVQ
jgi:hypothetical protein